MDEKASEKSSTGWLAIEDYFNYYLPVLLWIADLLLLSAIVDETILTRIQGGLSEKNQFGLLALGLVVPYLIGTVLAFLGSLIHIADKVLLHEPEKYVLNSKHRRTLGPIKLGTCIGKDLSNKILDMITKEFGFDLSLDSRYYCIQYSLEFAPFPSVQNHINRLTNLVNLHEGLISPLLFSVVLAFIASYCHRLAISNWSGWSLLMLTGGVWWRYHYLRGARAKRVYRYFYLWHLFGKRRDPQLKSKSHTLFDKVRIFFE